MRNFIGTITDKSIWAFILLIIAVWSAFAFYKAGYEKSAATHNQIILSQQEEITKLRNMLFIESHSSLRYMPAQLSLTH